MMPAIDWTKVVPSKSLKRRVSLRDYQAQEHRVLEAIKQMEAATKAFQTLYVQLQEMEPRMRGAR